MPKAFGRRDHVQLALDEALLNVFPAFGRQPGVEMVCCQAFQLKEFRDLFRLPPRRAVHDGATLSVGGQVGLENLMDMGEFLATGCRDHFKCKIGSLRAAVEYGEFDSELLPEVINNVLPHVRLGSRGQAEDGRHRAIAHLLADETADVAIVGPKIVPPARQAVRLVEHPSADLPLIERAAQGLGTELLGGDDEDARISKPNPIQRVLPLGQGEEAVYRNASADPACLQSRHLVRHQRNQGRDHDGQRSGLVKA